MRIQEPENSSKLSICHASQQLTSHRNISVGRLASSQWCDACVSGYLTFLCASLISSRTSGKRGQRPVGMAGHAVALCNSRTYIARSAGDDEAGASKVDTE